MESPCKYVMVQHVIVYWFVVLFFPVLVIFSALIELPYFDPPRMLIIDPMHNLFWGTGKHMLHLWVNSGILSNSDFSIIQETVDCMIVPTVVGRTPRKILTSFSSFTADQFKNWITLF